MPGHESLPPTENPRFTRRRLAAEKAVADNPDDEAAQIDALAVARGYFIGHGRAVEIVNCYINGTIDAQEAVRRIAEPIEYAYTTADGGRLFVSAEKCARDQRKYHEPEKALEMWGPEEDLEAFEAAVTDPAGAPTVEAQLWGLYFTILYAARKTSWRDEGAQQKLVNLVVALKARPDPEPPANMTIALKENWIYESGHLWSKAIMFGPSARESWNDYPGGGAGWYPVEVNGWTNVNAFTARLTGQHVHDFVLYAQWAIRDALDGTIEVIEGSYKQASSKVAMAESLFEVARVWILLAGKYVYEEESKNSGKDKESRWDRWQKRFEEEAARGQYSSSVTAAAKECAEMMSRIPGDTRTS